MNHTASADPSELLARLASDPELDRLRRLFDANCDHPDGVWNCDVGAITAGYLADRLGLTRRLRSGLYMHEDAASYNATMGYGEADWVDGRDEVHCWLEIDRPYGTVILDPNGGERSEPRLQLYDPEAGYRLRDDELFWIDCPYWPQNPGFQWQDFQLADTLPGLAAGNYGGYGDRLRAIQATMDAALTAAAAA